MTARRAVAFTCFVSFIAMGISSSILGPTLTTLALAINLPIANAGVIRAVQQIGMVAATFGGGFLLNRYRLRIVLTPGVLLMAVGLAGIALSGHLLTILAFGLLLGIGTGLLNVAANIAISTLYSENASPVLSVLHTCFGIGLFCGPLIAEQALKQPGSWPLAYLIPAVTFALLSIPFSQVAVDKTDSPAVSAAANSASGVKPAIRWLPLLPLVLLLFLYNGAGNGISDWIAPHLQLTLGIAANAAAQVASIYGFALTAGRAMSVVALQRLGNLRGLALGIGLAAFGAFLIVVGTSINGIGVGVALVGLGFSPIYPTVIAMSGQQQPENRGAVTGLVAGGASFGGIILPVVQGWVGAGQNGGMIVTLIASLLMIGAFAMIYRMVSRSAFVQTV